VSHDNELPFTPISAHNKKAYFSEENKNPNF